MTEQGRPREAEDGQGRVVRGDRPDDGAGLPLVVEAGVVERAVRLDVADPAADRTGQPVQRTDLVDHRRTQVGRRHVQEPMATPALTAARQVSSRVAGSPA